MNENIVQRFQYLTSYIDLKEMPIPYDGFFDLHLNRENIASIPCTIDSLVLREFLLNANHNFEFIRTHGCHLEHGINPDFNKDSHRGYVGFYTTQPVKSMEIFSQLISDFDQSLNDEKMWKSIFKCFIDRILYIEMEDWGFGIAFVFESIGDTKEESFKNFENVLGNLNDFITLFNARVSVFFENNR